MAREPRRRTDRAPTATNPSRAEAERLIAKGRFKDAVKQAKIAFKQDGTPEHHRLLERAYLLRAQQLKQGGMPTAAAEVAGHLLDFGITDPDLNEPLAALMLALGLTGQALELQQGIDAPEAKERLARQAADQAVLQPDRALAEIRVEALTVRAALSALEAGDEPGATAGLRAIARNSPFADWRLFVRGLAAFRRGSVAEARASWERLGPERAPGRIARALLALDGPSAADGPDLGPLERHAFGEPILGPLRELGALIAEDRWIEATRKLGPLRFALRRVDPRLAERLTMALYSPMIRAASDLSYREAKALIDAFTRAAEPLPIDPRWNRLWALVWEGPQGDPDHADEFWRKYLGDLAIAPALTVEERPRAQAFVWLRLGRQLLEEAGELAHDGPGPGPRRLDRETREIRRRAVEALEQVLRLDPSNRPALEKLREAYHDWDQPERAAEVARRLLRAFPDDFDAAAYLADYHFQRDEPAESLEFALRTRTLRPLDEGALDHEWAARVSLARHHALASRWDEARAELANAGRLRPERAVAVHFRARLAILELKAGQGDRAAAIIAETEAGLVEPTPLRLALTIESIRFQLPKSDRSRFEALWLKDLSKKCRSETAGALADLIGSFLVSKIDYPGRAEHIRQVLDYLRRTTRIKYRREDLARVCGVLGLVESEPALHEKLARRGLKLFPEAPEFPMNLGSIEMEKGTFGAGLMKARRHFEAALKLAESEAEAATNPNAAEMVARIKQALGALTDMMSGPLGMPFFGFPGGPGFPGPAAFGSIFGSLFGDDDDDDDDDDDELPPTAPPRPRRPTPTKRGRKKRS